MQEMKRERYLYHNFPRRGRNTEDEKKKGIAILTSVLDRGLLLVPERLEFREPLVDGSQSEPWALFQKRICFTELSPGALAEHAEHFGSFAIEWEIQSLRALGAVPVFYVPLSNQLQGAEGVGAALLSRLGEIQLTLSRLQCLKEIIDNSQEGDAQLNVTCNDKVVVNTRCTINGAQDLLSFLGEGVQTMDALLASVRALAGFFYPTENPERTEPLHYYQQREWRIIGNMVSLGKPVAEALTKPDEDAVLKIDADFFGGEMDFPSGLQQRVNQCQLYRAFGRQPLYRTIRRVIVPSGAVEEVTKLLQDRAIDLPVIALERLNEQPSGRASSALPRCFALIRRFFS